MGTTIDLTASLKQHRVLNQKLTVETRKLLTLQKAHDLLAAKLKKLKATNHSNNTSKNTWKGECMELRTQVAAMGGTVTPNRKMKGKLAPPPAVPASPLQLSDFKLSEIEEHFFSRYRAEEPTKPLFVLVTEAAAKVRPPPQDQGV